MFEYIIHSFSDRMTLLLLAVLVSVVFGGPYWLHRLLYLHKPAEWGQQFMELIVRKMNRANRDAASLRARGFIVIVFVFLVCLNIGGFVGRLAESTPWSAAFEIALIAYMLPMRAALEQTRALRKAMESGDTATRNLIIQEIGRRDPEGLDDHGAWRTAIEYLAKRFSDHVVGSAFWYLLFGIPALLFVMALGALDQQAGFRKGKTEAFGSLIARLDDVVQFLPSRIAALLIVVASFVSPSCNPYRALKGMAAGVNELLSPNSGASIGAMAGALAISLGGARKLKGSSINDKWIDFGSARIGWGELKKAQYLYAISCVVFVVLVTVLHVPGLLT